MAHDINQFFLTGHLVADPEFFPATQEGKKDVVRFRIAANYDDKRANYIPITVFGKIAASHAENLRKGSGVVVTGSISNNDFESNGVKHYSFNFVADDVKYIGGKPSDQDDE